ncbi:putative DNA modification/repair radical SAM protein [Roseisolibacter agri]|uniref:DNA modification/repair radical SAM protein n=1 Tax=Roseisolibacter agri TaxID=2014610 RepID=A0AA37VEQ8_9BACT|nr:putative DNA modification/repair radical SAM protein [Roseisolibacter agri]GLC25604.1 putative DNA modification/repair radical SAM protein [Roseisolibacter agri]
MELQRKLQVLADAAKYDASCASSGSKGRRATAGGVGSTEGMGICHSYTPDGRCVSLLKLLLTNYCLYDCLYCVNRRSSDVERARFSAAEVVRLTLDFYRRNYIEGLFLSSGIIRSPDYTMEQLALVARTLRAEHDFQGYIHLKTIPHADPALIAEAGRWADRLSINVELPTAEALQRLAPEKDLGVIRGAMHGIRTRIDESRAELVALKRAPTRVNVRADGPAPFAPAGQSTQLIVGATDASDATILGTASALYTAHRLRRVYYSAFSPIPDASSALPPVAPPLVREHRLYQADWLVRFYGFDAKELTTAQAPNLDLELDPKTAWALRHRELFPVDVNSAPRELLLRVPGVGARSVERLLQVRRWRRVRVADLAALRVALRRALPFLVTADGPGASRVLDASDLRARLLGRRTQLDLFAPPLASARSVIGGEL